jgi:DNA mismatch endonuclease (patch repair protein)
VTDKLSRARRSANMRAIRSRDMKPEVSVRRAAHALGYRFRLHRNDLPGKPDLVFVSRRTIIFVHGCFWHQHQGCIDGRMPRSNLAYWRPKLGRNVKRDAEHLARLRTEGWRAFVIWECEAADARRLDARLRRLLH